MKITDKERVIFNLGKADANWSVLVTIKKMARLAKRHTDLAVMDCNGEGTIRGIKYHTGIAEGKTDKYYTSKGYVSAYIPSPGMMPNEYTIFEDEAIKITDKIDALVKGVEGLKVEYQGDPRGATVRVFYKDLDCTELLY